MEYISQKVAAYGQFVLVLYDNSKMIEIFPIIVTSENYLDFLVHSRI